MNGILFFKKKKKRDPVISKYQETHTKKINLSLCVMLKSINRNPRSTHSIAEKQKGVLIEGK